MTQISTYLRTIRNERGWSLSELSARAGGLAKGYLSELEHGRSDPSLETLCKLADAYDVGAGDLLVMAGYTKHPVVIPETIKFTVTVTPMGGVVAERVTKA